MIRPKSAIPARIALLLLASGLASASRADPPPPSDAGTGTNPAGTPAGNQPGLAVSPSGATGSSSSQTGPLLSQAGLESRTSSILSTIGAIIRRGYSLDVGVDTLFDNNILRESGSLVQPNANRNDIVVTPSATLQAGLPVGRQQLYGLVSVGRDFYVHNTSYGRARISAGGGANLSIGPSCSGSISGQYSQREGTQLDLVAVAPNKQEDTVYSANALCGRAHGIGFGGGYSHSQTRNGSSIYNLLDSNTDTFSANVRYNSGALGSIILTGEYSDISYPGRGPPLFPAHDGVRDYTGRISYQRQIGPILSGSIGASYTKVVPKAPAFDLLGNRTNPGYSSPGFDISLSYHPGVRLSAVLSATRDVTASANVGASYVVNGNYGLDVTYKLSPRISTGVGGSYSKRDYRGSFSSVADPQARLSDTLYRTYVQLSYTPYRRYSVNFTVAQQGLRSRPNIFDYDSTTAAIGLHAKF